MKKELLRGSCLGVWGCGRGCFGKLALRRCGRNEKSLRVYAKVPGRFEHAPCRLGNSILLPAGLQDSPLLVPCFNILHGRHGVAVGFQVAGGAL